MLTFLTIALKHLAAMGFFLYLSLHQSENNILLLLAQAISLWAVSVSSHTASRGRPAIKSEANAVWYCCCVVGAQDAFTGISEAAPHRIRPAWLSNGEQLHACSICHMGAYGDLRGPAAAALDEAWK